MLLDNVLQVFESLGSRNSQTFRFAKGVKQAEGVFWRCTCGEVADLLQTIFSIRILATFEEAEEGRTTEEIFVSWWGNSFVKSVNEVKFGGAVAL